MGEAALQLPMTAAEFLAGTRSRPFNIATASSAADNEVMPAFPLPRALTDHSDAIAALCRAYGVDRLEVFGSAADDRFDPQRSDFDFIVHLAPAAAPSQGSLGRRFVGLAEGLEALLGRRVDLITDQPLRNPYFRRAVDASRRLLYER